MIGPMSSSPLMMIESSSSDEELPEELYVPDESDPDSEFDDPDPDSDSEPDISESELASEESEVSSMMTTFFFLFVDPNGRPRFLVLLLFVAF